MAATGTALPAAAPGVRVAELDALRGIAAFVVVLHHVYARTGHDPLPGHGLAGRVQHTLLHFSPLRMLEDGRAPVLFFFVLSGFVLTAALLRRGSPGLPAFAAQRTVRLGLPVLASVLLSAGLYLLFADPAVIADLGIATWSRPPGWEDVLVEAALLRTEASSTVRLNPVLWSLVHEWRLTLLMPLVLLFAGRPWLLLALAACAMALGVMGGAAENRAMLGPHLHSSVMVSLYFVPGIAAGAALALAGPPPRLSPPQRLAAGVAALALVGMRSDLASYVASVLLIVLALQPKGALGPVLRRAPLVWLGRVSFSLYLVHYPVLLALLCALDGALPRPATLLLAIPAALAAAAVMHALAERPARGLAVLIERRLSG